MMGFQGLYSTWQFTPPGYLLSFLPFPRAPPSPFNVPVTRLIGEPKLSQSSLSCSGQSTQAVLCLMGTLGQLHSALQFIQHVDCNVYMPSYQLHSECNMELKRLGDLPKAPGRVNCGTGPVPSSWGSSSLPSFYTVPPSSFIFILMFTVD